MGVRDNHQQNHDVVIQYKGMNVPVYVNDTLASSGGDGADGWRGGQWVMYTSNSFGPANNVKNIRVVGQSDGTAATGFLIRGSDFHPQVQTPGSFDLRSTEYNYSSYKPSSTRVVTMMFDGTFVFKMFEKYTFGDRTSSGIALSYSLNDAVYVSDRGYLTTLADATAAGIGTPIQVGTVWMIPSTDNDNTLGVDIRLF